VPLFISRAEERAGDYLKQERGKRFDLALLGGASEQAPGNGNWNKRRSVEKFGGEYGLSSLEGTSP